MSSSGLLILLLFRTFALGDKSVRLISIPKFSSSATVTVLNVKTLEASQVSFEVQM